MFMIRQHNEKYIWLNEVGVRTVVRSCNLANMPRLVTVMCFPYTRYGKRRAFSEAFHLGRDLYTSRDVFHE